MPVTRAILERTISGVTARVSRAARRKDSGEGDGLETGPGSRTGKNNTDV